MTRKYTLEQAGLVFWSAVDQSAGADGCWPWTRAKNKKGYGILANHAFGSLSLANRVAWFLTNGQIDEGAFVLHSCDNPPCCNPAHLRLGDAGDNAADRVERGREGDRSGMRNGSKTKPDRRAWGDRNGTRTHPEARRRGPSHHNARLDADAVREIRRQRAAGIPRAHVAAAFGVSPPSILAIETGKTWRHVSE